MVRDVVKLDDPMKGAFSAVRGVEGEPSGPILKPFWDSWIPWGSMVGIRDVFFSFFVGELFEDLQRHRERHEDLLQKVQAVEEMWDRFPCSIMFHLCHWGFCFSGLQDSPIHLLIWTPFSVISGPWLRFIIEIFRGAEISCRITTCSQDSPDSKWCQEHWQKMLHENCEKLRVGILRGTNRSDSRVTMIHWTNKAWLFLYAFKYHSQVHLVSPAAA